MTERQLELLDRAINALRSAGCRCQHNVPYAGCKIARKVISECARCRCLREYEAAKVGVAA